MRCMYGRLLSLRMEQYGTQKAFCKRARELGYRLTVRRYRAIESEKAKVDLYEIYVICKVLGGESAQELFDDWVWAEKAEPTERGLKDFEKDFAWLADQAHAENINIKQR